MTPVYAWYMVGLGALVWLGCGYISGGHWYAYMSAEYGPSAGRRTYDHCWFSVAFGLLAFASDSIGGYRKHGICWNWITKPALVPKPRGVACTVCGFQTTNVATLICTPCISKGHRPGLTATVNAQIMAAGIVSGQSIPSWASYYGIGLPTAKELPKSTSTDPIFGYRVWRLDRETGLLKSANRTKYTWPKRCKLARDPLENMGIHAVKHVSRLITGAASNPFDPVGSLWDEYTADVAGEVWLWGEVKECSLGYLAEFAYPKQLWVPEETDPTLVMMLEENYGVPVTMRSEFKKHAEGPQTIYLSYGKLGSNQLCVRCGATSPTSVIGLCPTCEKYQMSSRLANTLGTGTSMGQSQPAQSQAIVPYQGPKNPYQP